MSLRHYLSISTVLRVIFLFFKNFTNFEIEKTVFLEEALHAGLDLLPAEQKTKLRKDVLAWYKDLLTRHKNDERSKRIQRLFNTYNQRYKNELKY